MSGNKKILMLFSIIFCSIVFSQEYSITYNYTFKKDSTNIQFVENEMMR